MSLSQNDAAMELECLVKDHIYLQKNLLIYECGT